MEFNKYGKRSAAVQVNEASVSAEKKIKESTLEVEESLPNISKRDSDSEDSESSSSEEEDDDWSSSSSDSEDSCEYENSLMDVNPQCMPPVKVKDVLRLGNVDEIIAKLALSKNQIFSIQ